jgi:sulfoxide reductase catalytic subunit YedY
VLIKIPKQSDPRPSEIASEAVYKDRRRFVRNMGFIGASALLGGTACAQESAPKVMPLTDIKKSPFSTTEAPNSYEDITEYNNFYEFGTGKEDPYLNSGDFEPMPWNVRISGEAEVTGDFSYEDIIKPHALEDRIYRMRCVEAWSMVIPWVGIPLGDILKRFKPTSKAKYVSFETVTRPSQMPGQRRPILDWPYREGLTIEEAMHPLTILAVGLYGKTLPNQSGAPMRLVVPWKYGFKGIKSINSIGFTEKMPFTSWNDTAPWEYGFYANVNPEVDHPRWSQARERRIGGGLLAPKQPTLMFNGYADEVASLYSGLDLRTYF